MPRRAQEPEPEEQPLTLQWIAVERCIALRRNPQYLTPHEMEALKASIMRDGFLAPVLLRPIEGSDDLEVVSGNHRVMAAREVGMSTVPAVVGNFADSDAHRIAVNMNTIHGDPTVELLAPFLAELDNESLALVHLDEQMLTDLRAFDQHLAERLQALQVPDALDHASPSSETRICICPTCGKTHIMGSGEGVSNGDESTTSTD